MAATAASDASDGPVMNLINKRLRALRKKYNRIVQMEESIAQGKTLNKEQEEVLRSKPAVVALIEELEKLRSPISVAVSEEISLAIQLHQVCSDQTTVPDNDEGKTDDTTLPQEASGDGGFKVEDLMNLLYFGSLFDVKSQNDFASIMLTRTHERGCCLTYDYVTDDATDLLGERDLDLISRLGSLMISRPVDSHLSHKNALERCIEHAKLWLANSDKPIEPNANFSYAGLREKLNKIMCSDYFTTTPEIKAPVEVAAAAGNYVPFQMTGVPVGVPIQVEGSARHYKQRQEDASNFEEHEAVDDQSPFLDDSQKEDEPETEEAHVPTEFEAEQQEQLVYTKAEPEHTERDFEHREQQYVPRRSYQNQRGGRGGGRRGYIIGRGSRGARRGGGYQIGRNHHYDQPGGNYYQKSYYNNRGRGGRGSGSGSGSAGHPYNHLGPAAQNGGRGSSDAGDASA